MRVKSNLFLLASFVYTFFVFAFIAVSNQQTVKADTNHVVISQIQLSGTGNAQDEFVELYNPTDATIEMAGWRLTRKASSGSSAQNLVANLTGTIAPRGYYLVAHPSASTASIADKVYSSSSSAMTTNNTVTLFSDAGTTTVDKIGLGTAVDFETAAFETNPTNGQSIVRKASGTSTEASLSAGGAEANFGNGFDNDNNANDFVLFTTAMPRNTNSPHAQPNSTVTPSVTIAPTVSPTIAPSTTPSVEPTNTPIPTVVPTTQPTVTITPTSNPTTVPSPTATVMPTAVPTSTPTPTKTPTPTQIPTATPTVKPTNTPVPTATPQPSVTPTVTPLPTIAPTPTVTPTPTPGGQVIVDERLSPNRRLVCIQTKHTIRIFGYTFHFPKIQCKIVKSEGFRHHSY